jgi:hypothetical protein
MHDSFTVLTLKVSNKVLKLTEPNRPTISFYSIEFLIILARMRQIVGQTIAYGIVVTNEFV